MESLPFFYLIDALMQLVLPDRCRVCGEYIGQAAPKGICSRCLGQIKIIATNRCQLCGRVLHGVAAPDRLCGSCLQIQPPWERCWSLVEYGSPVSDLLHRLKYHADTSVMPALGTIIEQSMAQYDEEYLRRVELVLPVPLYSGRLKARGLNQSSYIARRLFSREMVDCSLLSRCRATAAQTGLSGAERRRNLRGAFVVEDNRALAGRVVCLVDDVFTTGATVGECCRALKTGGASVIYVVTLARVVTGR